MLTGFSPSESKKRIAALFSTNYEPLTRFANLKLETEITNETVPIKQLLNHRDANEQFWNYLTPPSERFFLNSNLSSKQWMTPTAVTIVYVHDYEDSRTRTRCFQLIRICPRVHVPPTTNRESVASTKTRWFDWQIAATYNSVPGTRTPTNELRL